MPSLSELNYSSGFLISLDLVTIVDIYYTADILSVRVVI